MPDNSNNPPPWKYGETLGQALLESILVEVSRPSRDTGIDFIACLPPHRRIIPENPVWFAFQVKTGNRFRVARNSFKAWPTTRPVILLHVRSISAHEQDYYFMVLHDWMLAHPDWPDKLRKRNSLEFDLNEFISVNEDRGNLLNALLSEEHRILQQPDALFYFRHSVLLPITEIDLFEHIPHIDKMEVPAALYEEMIASPYVSSLPIAWTTLRQTWAMRTHASSYQLSSPQLAYWLSRMPSDPDNPRQVQRARSQFLHFVDTMRSVQENRISSLPQFTNENIGWWRALCLLYPRSIDIIKAIILNPDRFTFNDIRGALNLTAALANADDPVVSGKAIMLMRKAGEYFDSSFVLDYQRYLVVRQYHYMHVEAEGVSQIGRFINFIGSNRSPNPIDDWELRLNREYYQSTQAVVASVFKRKSENPMRREVPTVPIMAVLRERFHNYLRW